MGLVPRASRCNCNAVPDKLASQKKPYIWIESISLQIIYSNKKAF